MRRCPDFPVWHQAAAGDNTLHMDMVAEFLVPGMKHLDDAGYCAKIFGSGGKFQESFGAAFVEKAVKKDLIVVQKRFNSCGSVKTTWK